MMILGLGWTWFIFSFTDNKFLALFIKWASPLPINEILGVTIRHHG